MRQINRAVELFDLRKPPGNRFEGLNGFMPLRNSIRINDQWRITSRWFDGGADDVRIEDYHRG
ncbi:MAG: type II toxin-antitoxin system RelE/ParE family toxin [Sphingomonas bacterium]|nr:type II toxin-antitoxin system RelE/ParE family toxin [Sphingomonas bacterium]